MLLLLRDMLYLITFHYSGTFSPFFSLSFLLHFHTCWTEREREIYKYIQKHSFEKHLIGCLHHWERMSSSSGQSSGYDLSFKILLIGDSAVGKSSLLLSFISGSVEDIAPTIGNSIRWSMVCSNYWTCKLLYAAVTCDWINTPKLIIEFV